MEASLRIEELEKQIAAKDEALQELLTLPPVRVVVLQCRGSEGLKRLKSALPPAPAEWVPRAELEEAKNKLAELERTHVNPWDSIAAERDETRRWLLDIGLELGVPVQVPGDENGDPHEAWRGLHKRIMGQLSSLRTALRECRKGLTAAEEYMQANTPANSYGLRDREADAERVEALEIVCAALTSTQHLDQ